MVDFDALFATNREHLWGLCYRVTGSAADAEDLVQETFARAIQRPPPDLERALRPWLVRVATNLAIDSLRKRRARRYVGSWLPTAIDSPPGATHGEIAAAVDVEVRYGLLESATAAFLHAVEVLSPVQRAALMLRDVLGYSGPETAAILETTHDNVRVLVHRARRALASYDADRPAMGAGADEASAEALGRFFSALLSGDVEAARACLAADVVAVSDGGGRVRAATKVVRGVHNVTALFEHLARLGKSRLVGSAPVRVNGFPAVRTTLREATPRDATDVVMQVEAGADGKIRRVFVWSSPEKLRSLG